MQLFDPNDSNAVAANRIVLAITANTVVMATFWLVEWFIMR